MTDHTRTEKIGGDSILFLVVLQVVAGKPIWQDVLAIEQDGFVITLESLDSMEATLNLSWSNVPWKYK